MKVAILTQPLKSNYGGILQNYALQQAIRNIGHSPVTLNIKFDHYSYFRWFLSFGYFCLLRLLGKHCSFPTLPKEQKRIDGICSPFINKYIVTTKEYFHLPYDTVKSESLEAIVVGSDQVWRPKYNKRIEDLFLQFAENDDVIRMSYAASFGTDQWEYSENQQKDCKNLLQLFDAVSVRENSGVELCSQFFGVDAKLVVDPTMLIEPSCYKELCSSIPAPETKFIFTYFFSENGPKKKFVERISKTYGLPVVSIDISDKTKTVSVEQWLAYIRDAEFVITDSYHGTLFSTYFEKNFVSIKHSSRGNTRFDTLEMQLGINSIFTEIQIENLNEIPRHDTVITKEEQLRAEGLQFLKMHLKKR